MIKKLAALFVLALAASLGVTISQAGAVPVACPTSGGGWLQGAVYAYNCSLDGNHVVMDAHNSSGLVATAVVDTWFPVGVSYTQFRHVGEEGFGKPAILRTCPYPAGGGNMQAIYPPNWAQQPRYYQVLHTGYWQNEGILSYNSSFIQAGAPSYGSAYADYEVGGYPRVCSHVALR